MAKPVNRCYLCGGLKKHPRGYADMGLAQCRCHPGGKNETGTEGVRDEPEPEPD